MNAVIYARYSHGPGQTEQSIEGQLRDCLDYAKKYDMTVIDTYIDRSISGTDFENREEFNRLLHDCERKQFNAVIVWKIDRLGRNRQELAMSKIKMKKHGVRLYYAKESIPDGPEGIILESLLEGMAEYYSADLSQKVKRGLRESMLKGHVLGANPMLGYSIVDKKYVPDPLSVPIVQEIFERYAAGDTAKKIRDSLNSRGFRTARGELFKNNTIYFALRNEKYIGTYRYGDIVVYDVIPAIIDLPLWQRVQDILQLNERNRSRSKTVAPEEFLLTGKIFCGYCQSTIIGESGTSRNGQTYFYYKCGAKKNYHAKCKKSSLRKEYLEDHIIKFTQEKILQPELIEYLIKRALEIQEKDAENFRLKVLNKQLREIEKALSNLVHAVELGIITDTTKQRMIDLENSKSELKLQIARCEIVRPKITADMLRFWLHSFKNGEISNPEFKMKLVNTFLHSIYLYNDYAIVVYNFCNNDGSAKRSEIRLELNAILKKDQEQCSSVPGQVPATGIEPVRSLTLAGF